MKNMQLINWRPLNRKRLSYAASVGLMLIMLAFVLRSNIELNYMLFAGVRAYEHNELGDSEIYFLEGTKSELVPSELYYNLGNSYYRQDRYKEAVQAYNKALVACKSDSLHVDILANMGNAYFYAGDTLHSLLTFRKALIADTSDQKVRQNFLYVLQQLNRNKGENLNDQKEKNKKLSQKDYNSKSSSGDEAKGKKTREESVQDQNVTEQEMEVLFDMINQSEKSVERKISKLKHKQKASQSDEIDY
jgi:Ca-activated chloride channel homolog